MEKLFFSPSKKVSTKDSFIKSREQENQKFLLTLPIIFIFCQFHLKYANIETTAHTQQLTTTLHHITLGHNTQANKYATLTFAHIETIVLQT